MNFHVLSLFPDEFLKLLSFGVIGKAIENNIVKLKCWNPRDYSQSKHGTVDDKPYGGSDGMLMLYEPVARCLDAIESKEKRVVHLSPQGEKWSHKKAKAWAQSYRDTVLICSRYSGMDQRLINEYVDEEVSLGDFVISGGELAAAVLIDSVSRFLPGVLGNIVSAEEESFNKTPGLEAPQFSKPREIPGAGSVPEVLLSGNHQKISEWEELVGILTTMAKRPDLLTSFEGQKINQALEFWKKMPLSERQLLGLEKLSLSRELT